MRKNSPVWRVLADAGKLALGAGLLWMGMDLANAQAPTPASAAATTSHPAIHAAALYGTHCASCHGATRTGGMGPALLPESLERLRRPAALQVVREGRPATQMAGFAHALSAAEIEAVTDWIYQPVTPA
ncbi:MAG: cytochrome c, partial [Simplicispira sp.]|nr:cytochrome c [Simplicispira sp.]